MDYKQVSLQTRIHPLGASQAITGQLCTQLSAQLTLYWEVGPVFALASFSMDISLGSVPACLVPARTSPFHLPSQTGSSP